MITFSGGGIGSDELPPPPQAVIMHVAIVTITAFLIIQPYKVFLYYYGRIFKRFEDQWAKFLISLMISSQTPSLISFDFMVVSVFTIDFFT